ncbi:MAG: hypothetical protein ACAH11_08775 [Sphingomonas sp.]
MIRMLAAATMLMVAVAAPAAAQERIFAPVGGISIIKPAAWYLIPPDESLANLQGFEFEDPQVQRSLAAPLITLTRDPIGTVGGIIPTIKVNYVAYPGIGRLGAMGAVVEIIDIMRGAYADLKVLKAPYAATIAGLPGARALIAFSVRQNGRLLEGETEMVVIQRGNLGIYTLGYAYPAGQAARGAADFDMVFASLRIDAGKPSPKP